MPKKRGGRKRLIDTQPQVDANFQTVLNDHTAGDPMQTDSFWTNLSKEEISRRLEEQGTPASPKIVQQLLDLHDIGRRQAFKNLTMGQHKDRNAQFENIATLKSRYFDSLDPLMSIDTKKRELMGLFYRDGQLYVQKTQQVWDHDFPSFGTGVVIPHGLYDLKRNAGYLNLGTSHDTSEFACDSIWHGGRTSAIFSIQMRSPCCCCAMAAAATVRHVMSSKKRCKTSRNASASRFVWLTIRHTPPSTIRSNTACSRT